MISRVFNKLTGCVIAGCGVVIGGDQYQKYQLSNLYVFTPFHQRHVFSNKVKTYTLTTGEQFKVHVDKQGFPIKIDKPEPNMDLFNACVLRNDGIVEYFELPNKNIDDILNQIPNNSITSYYEGLIKPIAVSGASIIMLSQ